jgi:NTE family protein
MAVPGVFSPIVIDDRVLVDGGVVMNLPVELARDMGADVIIAVEVLPSARTRDQLRSLSGQLAQTVSLMIADNMDAQARDADVLIRADVGNYRASDFGKVGEMIPLGEAAARELEPVLRTMSLSEEAWRAHLEARSATPMRRFETIESVQIDIGSTADPEEVLDRVSIRPGDPFDVERIARNVQDLWELGGYERVDFYATPGAHGAIVHLEAHDRSWGPHVMRFGLNLVTDFAGESLFNVLANYTMTGLGRANAEAKFAVRVGEETGAFAEWYQPLSRDSRFFVAPVVGTNSFGVDVLLDESLFGDYKVRYVIGGLDLGYNLGRWGEARFGLVRGSGDARPREGPSVLPSFDLDWGGWQGVLVIDQLDNPNFPQDGYIVGAELLLADDALGSDSDYERLLVEFTGASTWARHTLIGTLEFGSALGSDLPFWQEFELGGLFRLSGYDPGTFAGPYLTHALLGWYYRVGNVATGFGDGIYIGLSAEAGNVWETSSEIEVDGLRFAGAAFVGVDTVFGPLYLAYGHTEDGQGSFYLYVGRSF